MRARTIVIATVAALWLVVAAGAALAKGPKSATISGPGIEEPTEVRMIGEQDLITDLLEQTQLWYGPGYNAALETRPEGNLGTPYTVRWVISYPSGEEPIIVQYLYLDAPGGPVIHTPMQSELEEWGAGVIGWFRAPDELRATVAAFDLPDPKAPQKVIEPSPTTRSKVAKPLDPGPVTPAAEQHATQVASTSGAPAWWPGGTIALGFAALVLIAGTAWLMVRRGAPVVR